MNMNRLIALADQLLPWRKRRAALRALWGLPGDKDGSGARWYFDLTRQQANRAAVVDDKTWSDLEFPRLFTVIDTTITPIGRQHLFDQLRTYEYETEEMDRRLHAYQVLGSNRQLREDLQLALQRLDIDTAAYIADLLLGPEPERLQKSGFVVPCMLLAIGAIILAIAHLVPVWLWLIPVAINVTINFRVDAKLGRNVDALLECGRMLVVAHRIAAVRSDGSFEYLSRLKSEAGARKGLQSQVTWLAEIDRIRSIPVFGGVVEIMNSFFLLKLALYTRSIERFSRSRSQWLSTFQLIGAVDASIAVANFLCRYPAHCRPSVVSEHEIRIQNGYHALISNPVGNSLELVNRSALVTGSNMTGKTTFIKMIAMNVVLGHTLGICLAEQATLPRSPVRALVRGEQAVETGKSRYFAEAEAIRDFIDESATGDCRIFILDEPFSGTNTVERIAIGKAVLSAISANAQILVTTHDVELQHLLGDRFELFHFQEDPTVESFFDHRLHLGASTQRNAIRVLERLGYPTAIIAEALATVPAVDRAPST
jgi:predicted ATPase